MKGIVTGKDLVRCGQIVHYVGSNGLTTLAKIINVMRQPGKPPLLKVALVDSNREFVQVPHASIAGDGFHYWYLSDEDKAFYVG